MCSVFESCQCSTQIQTFRLLFTALKGTVFITILFTRSAKLAPPQRAAMSPLALQVLVPSVTGPSSRSVEEPAAKKEPFSGLKPGPDSHASSC